jgi:hypothetical protein
MNTNDQPIETLVRELIESVNRAAYSESVEGMREGLRAAVEAFESARRVHTTAGRWEALQGRVETLHEDPPSATVDPFDPYTFNGPESRR